MKRFTIAVALFVGFVAVGAAADDNDKALKELDGEYALKSMHKGGEPAPDDVVKSLKDVKIKGGVLSIKMTGETMTAKIQVDVSKKPAHFDMTQLDGPEKDVTLPGLYKLEKGELTIVVTEPSQDRPTNFEGKGEKEMKLVLTKKGK